MARLSLMAYAIGLPGFILVKVLAPGFYARQDTRTPVRFGIYAMVSNMLLNIAFVVPMAMAGIKGPHAGLALATGLAAFINAGLLFRQLRRDGVYQAEPGWGSFTLRILLANGAMVAFLWLVNDGALEWLSRHAMERAMHLGGLIAGAAVIYIAVLLLLGIRPRQLLGKMD
jgi:putative peptidoglycan lipid II flippase